MTEINWVKVTDRLPPVGRFVIVARKSGYNSTPIEYCTAFRRENIHGDGWFWFTIGNDHLTDSGNDPTHWCDLLCPP